jgi:sialic acid synthase SpsE
MQKHDVIWSGDRKIGTNAAAYLIAEVGTTCLGDLDAALELVDAGAEAGLDAVKFQVVDPEQLSDKSVTYKVHHKGEVKLTNMYEMFSQLSFKEDEWRAIKDRCDKAGVQFFATADFEAGVDLLDRLDAPIHKLGAWDTTYRPLIEHMGRSGKPILVDLGPTTEGEIEDLLTWAGAAPVIFLHDFHTHVETQMNLNAIAYLKDKYGIAGWSSPGLDHDLDFAALALGAKVIEKRLILDRDSQVYHAHQSLEPGEMNEWVSRIRHTERALGSVEIIPSESDQEQSLLYYRSICTSQKVQAGEVFGPGNLTGKRPGNGMPTKKMEELFGRKAARDIAEDTLISEEDIS